MDVILYKFDCETILMTEEDKDTNTYRDVADTMENRGYERTLPVVGQQYSLGDADFTILAPSGLSGDSNNNSVSLLLTHGSNRILFTGDAEEEEEEEMMDGGILSDVDVYKAGHHGSRTSSSEKLLETVSPEYAVISCGEGNSYGHPHAETMNQFRARGIQVFRTDEQGTIVMTSDGSEILWNCSPSDTWLAGEPTGSAETKPQEQPSEEAGVASSKITSAGGTEVTAPPEERPAAEAVSYICNTNTKKFHYPECSSVKQMKDTNKLPTSAAREELIGQGYDPCKKCNP
jgi:competence protein ComEC